MFGIDELSEIEILVFLGDIEAFPGGPQTPADLLVRLVRIQKGRLLAVLVSVEHESIHWSANFH